MKSSGPGGGMTRLRRTAPNRAFLRTRYSKCRGQVTQNLGDKLLKFKRQVTQNSGYELLKLRTSYSNSGQAPPWGPTVGPVLGTNDNPRRSEPCLRGGVCGSACCFAEQSLSLSLSLSLCHCLSPPPFPAAAVHDCAEVTRN